MFSMSLWLVRTFTDLSSNTPLLHRQICQCSLPVLPALQFLRSIAIVFPPFFLFLFTIVGDHLKPAVWSFSVGVVLVNKLVSSIKFSDSSFRLCQLPLLCCKFSFHYLILMDKKRYLSHAFFRVIWYHTERFCQPFFILHISKMISKNSLYWHIDFYMILWYTLENEFPPGKRLFLLR